MWSEQIDVPLDEIGELPERVATRVARALGHTFERLQPPSGTRSAEAYDEYLYLLARLRGRSG